jgi:hypothetical protein
MAPNSEESARIGQFPFAEDAAKVSGVDQIDICFCRPVTITNWRRFLTSN